MQLVDVVRVERDKMRDFRGRIAVLNKIAWHPRETSHLAGTLETEDEEIHDETVELEGEGGKLQSTDGANQSEEALQEDEIDLLVPTPSTVGSPSGLHIKIPIHVDSTGTIFSPALAIYLVCGAGAVHKPGSAANIGFSLNMAVGFSGAVLVRCLSESEVNGNRTPTDTWGVPPAYWPTSGELTVENLSAKYNADGPEILHGLNFHIRSGECVGVIGRTGSGKNSILTSEINLDALRTNMTIILQALELLSDTLRGNLDPFGQCDDTTLNDTLRAAGLFSVQSGSQVGGSDFDKLPIFGEAASAIDYETDAVIHNPFRTNLGSDVMMFTIAYRLQTITGAGKIIVLDAGNVV
ncbi:hypothetical protein BDM02DRAFT_3271340 [Thelephora ganbajun]|uniref:Uncharacterized protein n=1 Tax=Thelephora ganbajun TaxID=370292 RepID=A0ACB6Z9I7_THEGA|nr:hypothetical protein BDM02DRAFT_3271340 [Thelephora ganbajun]